MAKEEQLSFRHLQSPGLAVAFCAVFHTIAIVDEDSSLMALCTSY
jgi:hypothetical protein